MNRWVSLPYCAFIIVDSDGFSNSLTMSTIYKYNHLQYN